MDNKSIIEDSKPFSWTHEYLYYVLTQGQNCIIKNKALANAFKKIDRIDFVNPEYEYIAHMDNDIDMGYGCILNKPTVIAQILQILDPEPGKNIKVLDIGTGTGYVAALLAIACGENSSILSLERVQFLTDISRINLSKYPDITNVKIFLRDGNQGLKEQAPFDYIHISASFENIPEDLSAQLKVGGKLIIPTTNKEMHLIERTSNKEYKETIHQIFEFSKIKTGIE